MRDYTELISNITETGLFAGIEAAEPVAEILPTRMPYLNQSQDGSSNSLFEKYNPRKNEFSAEISEDELDMMAEYEVDFLMTEIDVYMGLGKGGFAELIISDDDILKLRRSQNGEQFAKGEIESILERQKVKERFESTEPSNRLAKRALMTKLVKADLIRKRANGTLKLPSVRVFLFKMLLSEFSELSGKNIGVFSSVGKNIVSRLKKIM